MIPVGRREDNLTLILDNSHFGLVLPLKLLHVHLDLSFLIIVDRSFLIDKVSKFLVESLDAMGFLSLVGDVMGKLFDVFFERFDLVGKHYLLLFCKLELAGELAEVGSGLLCVLEKLFLFVPHFLALHLKQASFLLKVTIDIFKVADLIEGRIKVFHAVLVLLRCYTGTALISLHLLLLQFALLLAKLALLSTKFGVQI